MRAKRVGRFCAVVAGLAGAVQGALAGVVPATTVALSGRPAPGAPAGVTYQYPMYSFAGAGGTFAAQLTMQGPGIDFDSDIGLWRGTGASSTLLAREGEQAPGLPDGVKIDILAEVRVNGSHVLFDSFLTGTGVTSTNRYAVFYGGGAAVQPVYREGDAAPGIANATLLGGSRATMNSAGQIAWSAGLAGPGVTPDVDDTAVYIGTPSAPQLVLRSGTAAPGIGGGANVAGFYAPVINNSGKIAIEGWLSGTGVDFNNDTTIWAGAPAALNLIARTGDHAPGTPAGVTFVQLRNPYLNAVDQVIFAGQLSGPGVTPENEEAIWRGSVSTGVQDLVLRAGDQAIGFAPGIVYSSIEIFKQTSAGKLLVRMQVRSDADTSYFEDALYFGEAGFLELVARSEDPTNPLSGDGVDANALGQVVWVTRNPVSGSAEDIYVRAANGTTRRLVGAGDQLDVGGGDLRTIDFLGFGIRSSPWLQDQYALTDDGVLVFNAVFTDGSRGVFTMSAIPEPAGLAVGGVAMGMLAVRRRARGTLSGRGA